MTLLVLAAACTLSFHAPAHPAHCASCCTPDTLLPLDDLRAIEVWRQWAPAPHWGVIVSLWGDCHSRACSTQVWRENWPFVVEQAGARQHWFTLAVTRPDTLLRFAVPRGAVYWVRSRDEVPNWSCWSNERRVP